MLRKIISAIVLLGLLFPNNIIFAEGNVSKIHRIFDGYDVLNIQELSNKNIENGAGKFYIKYTEGRDFTSLDKKGIYEVQVLQFNSTEDFYNNLRTDIKDDEKGDYFKRVDIMNYFGTFASLSAPKSQTVAYVVCGKIGKKYSSKVLVNQYYCGEPYEVSFDKNGIITTKQGLIDEYNDDIQEKKDALALKRKYIKATYEKIKSSRSWYLEKDFETFEDHIRDLIKEGGYSVNGIISKLGEIDYNSKEVTSINGLSDYIDLFVELESIVIEEEEAILQEEKEEYIEEAINNYSDSLENLEELKEENTKLKEENTKLKEELEELKEKLSSLESKLSETSSNVSDESSILAAGNSKGDIIVNKILIIINNKAGNSSTLRSQLIDSYIKMLGNSNQISDDLKEYILLKLESSK